MYSTHYHNGHEHAQNGKEHAFYYIVTKKQCTVKNELPWDYRFWAAAAVAVILAAVAFIIGQVVTV